MPMLKVIQLGKPAVEGLVEDGTSYATGFRQLGLAAPKDGQLLVNGVTPARAADTIRRDTTVHFNAAVKGAKRSL